MAEITVREEGDEPEPSETPAPAGPASPLALLRDKRQQLETALHVDLAVPRWETGLPGRKLWVRYRPGKSSLLAGALEKREKAHNESVRKGGTGDPDRVVRAHADVLVDACVAIYDLDADEKPPEGDLPPGEYPTFSSEALSEALGVRANAVETARKLYLTDDDLSVAAVQLMNWSGQASEEATKGFLAQ